MSSRKVRADLAALRSFLTGPKPRARSPLTAVSLFSGAGLSDTGYRAAGFRFVAHAELDEHRAAVGEVNFPESDWIVGDVRETEDEIVESVREGAGPVVDLMVCTPPCQGMSSSNPSRGKRRTPSGKRNEEKNALLLVAADLARRVCPRVIVAENVRQILTQPIHVGNNEWLVVDLLRHRLPQYRFWSAVVNVADYGVPQDRKRAVVVGVARTEPWCAELERRNLAPWPRPTHGAKPQDGRLAWVTLRQWCEAMKYQTLDASSPERAKGKHALHVVPDYDPQRYRLIADIPANSGRSAYENDRCPTCNNRPVPRDAAHCPRCDGVMWNRPVVGENGSSRLIKGFHSSYRRMRPDRPAATITTNSSHVGSDFKIHPSENRVLSALECADLQTVPRWFDWTAAFDRRQAYLVRNLVGESFPAYFTYLHGRVLRDLMEKGRTSWSRLDDAPSAR